MPALPPESFFVDDRQRKAALVGEELGDTFEAVEAILAASWTTGHSELFLVPFMGGRADHVLCETVDPLTDVLLVLAEFEAERRFVGCVADLFLDYFFGSLRRYSINVCYMDP